MHTYTKSASPMARRIGFGFVLVWAAACSSNGDTGDAGDAGDAGADSIVLGGCQTAKLPTEDTCVVNDAQGIFVSSSMGSAAGDGTKAKPFASLNAGIAAAASAKKRVYACAETYAETITLVNGASIFGYFDCSKGWTVGTSHAKVQPTTSPVATAANIADPTRVEAVDLVGPDFTDNSQSSIGIIVTGSPGLTITHATIHAGTGGKGADGTAGVSLTDSGTAKNGANSTQPIGACVPGAIGCPLLFGIHARATAFGAGGTNSCGNNGGNGGTGGEFQALLVDGGYAWVAESSYPTTGGSPTQASTQTAQGGIASGAPFGQASPGSAGANGANGTDGTSGGAVGTFSASGYTTSDGKAGTDGQPGQGGGGAGGYGPWSSSPLPGAGYYGWGESGAGGGAGGCPGLAGTLGKGGGASVAVIAVQSAFVLDNVTLESSSGGNGGAAGSPGVPTSTAGGSGGLPSGSNTRAGGAGGAGGSAGLSGSGGGGPSIGLAFQGTQPTLTTSTITQGQGGLGVTTQAPNSPAGLSKDVYSF